MRVHENVEGIGICTLTARDVVRHELVQRIVKAYAEYESKKPRTSRRQSRTASSAAGRKNKHEDHQGTVYAA